jgi:uncharacterized protein YlzI (FlbEa/FlbD family)
VPKTHATQKTLKELRDNGWICCIVERYLNHPGMKFPRRIDAFGIGDILACRPSHGVYDGDGKLLTMAPAEIALVQCFPDSGGKVGFAAHREKILALPDTTRWLSSGGSIYLYGWKKRKGRWQCKCEEVVFA